jgi:hypothetical protein
LEVLLVRLVCSVGLPKKLKNEEEDGGCWLARVNE